MFSIFCPNFIISNIFGNFSGTSCKSTQLRIIDCNINVTTYVEQTLLFINVLSHNLKTLCQLQVSFVNFESNFYFVNVAKSHEKYYI